MILDFVRSQVRSLSSVVRSPSRLSLVTSETAILDRAKLIFDEQWYLSTYPEVRDCGLDPFDHYLKLGFKEKKEPNFIFDSFWYRLQDASVREDETNPLKHYCAHRVHDSLSPSPLFDPEWYLETYADVKKSRINPLAHYIRHGAAEGRSPNPYFDSAYYLSQVADGEAAKPNSLIHYFNTGEKLGLRPSSGFDPKWYLTTNADVGEAGMSPLRHFLMYGLKEGRDPSPIVQDYRSVLAADIVSVKEPVFTSRMAVFITHSPDGKLKPHVAHYVQYLRREGIETLLIIAADRAYRVDEGIDLGSVAGLLVRQNEGFDFAAWAHAIRLYVQLYETEELLFLNDSIVGPFNETLFHAFLDRARKSDFDMVGATDNYEIEWHVQSYFLLMKSNVIRSYAFQNFFSNVASHSKKSRVIHEYEVRLAPVLVDAGLKCGVLFPSVKGEKINKTIYGWRQLIADGFPFVKVTTIRDKFPDLAVDDWRQVLEATGFDVSLAEKAIARPSTAERNIDVDQSDRSQLVWSSKATCHNDVLEASPVARSAFREDNEFSSGFYLTLYEDVAASGTDPYKHYVEYGRAEGRVPRLLGFDDLDDLPKNNGKETALVVSHEGVRGGAPILAYNIAVQLKKEYNVIALFLSDGPMLKACRNAGVTVVGPVSLRNAPKVAEYAVRKILEKTNVKFAVLNTIESRYALEALSGLYIPNVILVHEFASYIRPRSAFRDAVKWSSKTVFSAGMTHDCAVDLDSALKTNAYPIIPQGLSLPPMDQSSRVSAAEHEKILETIRPVGFPADGIVVLGAGYVEYRKGVDLFIDCASRVVKGSRKAVRFVWMGRGFDPERDTQYSVYLEDQIRRAGIERDFIFLNEVMDVQLVYAQADLFMLTSRLDPLPNVAIEALYASLPVVCFENASGIADVLGATSLQSDLVAKFLDTNDMAAKVIAFVNSPALLERVSSDVHKLAAKTFDMSSYMEKIKEILFDASSRYAQEKNDAQIILDSNVISDAYTAAGDEATGRAGGLVRSYVRSWATGIDRRKLFPGFHPGIYMEDNEDSGPIGDPLAHYIRAGFPRGPWTLDVIDPGKPRLPDADGLKTAVHIHAYYPDLLNPIIAGLRANTARPDLFISVTSQSDKIYVCRETADYEGLVDVRVVPNIGRDLGPLFTEFGSEILNGYDLFGHFHTKKTLDLGVSSVGSRWYRFLLEHLIGGVHVADAILAHLKNNPKVGMVMPDDPHVVGWDKNKGHASEIWSRLSDRELPENFWFPIGSMFWARTSALRPLFDLNLSWDDYPCEPLPYDGSMLHALERLLGQVVQSQRYELCTIARPGINR